MSVRVPLQEHEILQAAGNMQGSITLPITFQGKPDHKPLMSLDVNELIRQILLKHAKSLGNDSMCDTNGASNQGKFLPKTEQPYTLPSHGDDVSFAPDSNSSADNHEPVGIHEDLGLHRVKEEPQIGSNMCRSFLERGLQNDTDNIQSRAAPEKDMTIKVELHLSDFTSQQEEEHSANPTAGLHIVKDKVTPSYYKKRGRPRKSETDVKGKSKAKKTRLQSKQNDKNKQDGCEGTLGNILLPQPIYKFEGSIMEGKMSTPVEDKSSATFFTKPGAVNFEKAFEDGGVEKQNIVKDIKKQRVQLRRNKDCTERDDTSEIVTENGKRYSPPIPTRRSSDGRLMYVCSVEGCTAQKTSRNRMIDHLNIHAGCKPHLCPHPGNIIMVLLVLVITMKDQRILNLDLDEGSFLSPPVQLARWAHMPHCLSVCLSQCLPQLYRTTLCTTDLRCAPPTCVVHHGARRGPMSVFVNNSDRDGAQYSVCLSVCLGL